MRVLRSALASCLPSRDGEKITPVFQVRSPVDSARLCFVCSRRPVPVRRAVGAAPEPLSVDDSSDSGSSSDDDSSAILFTQRSSSSSTCCVSFQVRYSRCWTLISPWIFSARFFIHFLWYWSEQWGEVVTSRCHGSKISGTEQTVVLQIWQEKNIKIVLTVLCNIALRDKLVTHTFLPSFDNEIGRLCQERLLRSRNFSTMVTCRHSSLYLFNTQDRLL